MAAILVGWLGHHTRFFKQDTLMIIAFTLGAFIAIATGAPGLRFYYGTVASFLALGLGCVSKSIH